LLACMGKPNHIYKYKGKIVSNAHLITYC